MQGSECPRRERVNVRTVVAALERRELDRIIVGRYVGNSPIAVRMVKADANSTRHWSPVSAPNVKVIGWLHIHEAQREATEVAHHASIAVYIKYRCPTFNVHPRFAPATQVKSPGLDGAYRTLIPRQGDWVNQLCLYI